jgi:3-oxoacyl-[acyl-carrier protein] reductase
VAENVRYEPGLPLLSAKHFLPTMRKKKWGRFVGISSNMVGLAIPGMSHYIATKMGIIGFMRGLANDVANDGITANAVLPGLTNTLATAPQSGRAKTRHLGTAGH